ncbi:DNA cytosine methyltransferase [Limibacter armeniacum]|uniref:DNA cytosine methyltransferase n=1 Tax=Limibacter armeniacum TaxID=466084 RepID=UPI002FE60DB5
MNHIELFAGCGGLSLGLESLGFELVFANELSPMASETFAYNFFGENLTELAGREEPAQMTYWLNSQFERNNLTRRLRENPQEVPDDGTGHNDLLDEDANIQGSMVVGNIIELNGFLETQPELLQRIQHALDLEGDEVDLVSGGPPCQSFSMAGLRQHDNARNQLPWEFARFVRLVKPKVALLENVSGILRAFDIDGKKHYAWFEVAKAFATIGYVPICLHVNAKYTGTAQNRPRYIMLALREDVFQEFQAGDRNEVELSLLENSHVFYTAVQGEQENEMEPVMFGDLEYHDIEKNPERFTNTFLAPLLQFKEGQWRSVTDAIDDLRGEGIAQSAYVQQVNHELLGNRILGGFELGNHEHRGNGELVQRRFRLYQVLEQVVPATKKNINAFLRRPDETILEDGTVAEMLRFDFLNEENYYIRFNDGLELDQYLRTLLTKKQTQRALVANRPAPAALSIPDDACHYHHDELRTLTVREMARIQSFPDWFEFRSKVTTGGQMRKFEVPQYTQVGNAVPPLLGRALGQVVTNVLNA